MDGEETNGAVNENSDSHDDDHSEDESGDELQDPVGAVVDNMRANTIGAYIDNQLLNILGNPDDSEESSDASGEGDSESDMGAEERVITFDPNTPATHSYLGDDLEDVQGRTIFDDNSEVKMMAYVQDGVVLMPNQILPFYEDRRACVAMLRTAVEQQKTIAILHLRHREPLWSYDAWSLPLASVGTTAQVLSISSESDNGPDSFPVVKAISIGRQRFKLMDVSRSLGGILSVKVKILPEFGLADPLEGCRPPSHLKLNISRPGEPGVLAPLSVSVSGNKLQGQGPAAPASIILRVVEKSARLQLLVDAVAQHDLMVRVKAELERWGGDTLANLDGITSPNHMSHWIAANIPITDDERIDLLETKSCIYRLQCELQLLRKFKSLCCQSCQAPMASLSDVFSLSRQGPMGTYVNPAGHIHDILTVHKAKSLSHYGPPQTEFSWFPGYAWTIVSCYTCGDHKGWLFTATDDQLQPASFYGLRRAGVSPKREPDQLPGQPHTSEQPQTSG